MTMRTRSPWSRRRNRTAVRIPWLPSIGTHTGMPLRAGMLRIAVACLLGVAPALLVSCGSSSKSLIPAADAGPLESDFQAVADAARAGNGNCKTTEVAILNTEQAFRALPVTIDSALRERLVQGIKALREHALELCLQPLSGATTTNTAPKTTPSTSTTPTTPTPTQPTTPTPTQPTTPTTPGQGGGTPAPESGGGAEASPGASPEQGGAGEGPPRNGSGSPGGAAAGGKEGGK
jgi:hypothetical protein